MSIKGRVYAGSEFTLTVLTNNAVYVINKTDNSDWVSIGIGQMLSNGRELTKEYLECWRDMLSEKEWEFVLR